MITNQCSQLLQQYADIPIHLFVNDSLAYTEEQRHFATALHCYSPKTYEFYRQTLKLPAVRTLRRWKSGYEYRPGFTEQVFATLQEK